MSQEEIEQPEYRDRALELQDKTVLKPRESHVMALKEQGYTHEQIALILNISKGAVDTYSVRINDRIRRVKGTIDELEIDLENN